MKLSILVASFVFNAGLLAQHAVIHIPESNDIVTVSLTQPDKDTSGFSTVAITVNGHQLTFHPRNPVACAPASAADRKNNLDWADVKGMQLDPSSCFRRSEYGSNVKHTLLAFMSHGYASDAGPTFIIGFDQNATPYKVLERNELDLFAFEPSVVDETARIIGFPSLSQVMFGDGGNGSKAPYATTYDPRAVYIIRPGERAQYSLEESRLYNEQHYVWAGPLVSESYAVVYNYPGYAKPFGISAKRLDALFAKLQEKKKP
jgi:hypothetical protein